MGEGCLLDTIRDSGGLERGVTTELKGSSPRPTGPQSVMVEAVSVRGQSSALLHPLHRFYRPSLQVLVSPRRGTKTGPLGHLSPALVSLSEGGRFCWCFTECQEDPGRGYMKAPRIDSGRAAAEYLPCASRCCGPRG